MKPIKLELSAFGPFAGKVEVDFKKFEHDGLFLLHGETGAGKTTIFDAISYVLYGEVSGNTRGTNNLRSDFADPETETYVNLIFEYRGITYSIRRRPEYERPKKSGKGTTKTVASVEFIMPDRTLTKTRDVKEAVEALLSVDHAQFKQIMMIAQGEFLDLVMAGSDKRTEIMRRIFSTGVFTGIQKRLQDCAAEAKRQHDALKDELSRLERSVINDVDTSDSRLEALAKKRAEVKKEMEAVVVRIDQAGQLNSALTELDKNKRSLAANEELSAVIQNEFNALKADEPRRKQTTIIISELESSLPRYKELTKKNDLCRDEKTKLEKAETDSSRLDKQIESETALLAVVKNTVSSLSSAEIDLLKVDGELQNGIKRAKQIDSLRTAHQAWINDKKAYSAAQDDYLTKKRLFDDGIAGRLAGELSDGKPCPVCGAINHPNPARPLQNAPSQAELQKSESQYNFIRDKCNKSMTIFENLSKELDIPENGIAESVTSISDLVTMLREKKKAAEENATTLELKRKEETSLTESISDRQQSRIALHDRVSDLRTATAVLTNEIETLKKGLRHENESAARKELNDIKSKLANEVKTLEDKEHQAQAVSRSIASLTALIDDGNKRIALLATKLGAGQGMVDLSGYEALRRELDVLSVELENAERIALSAKEQNERAASEIAACKIKLESSEELFRDADLLAKTANGNLAGKNKLQFETYVQQVYFDMVLEQANKRFRAITDERLVLSRRNADRLSGKAGLDLDVFDNWTQTYRPANTLSGGQGFMAALSLALGLSDVVQHHSGGVRIDAMFIDEGFASLDANSLDNAMNVVASLADGNRLVGIISHVEALNDRIENKVLIKRGKAGSEVVQK